MAQDMKKLAVIEKIREKYNRTCRLHRGTPKYDISIHVSIDMFPETLRLTLDELILILSKIQKEYEGKIRIGPLNNNSIRVKHDYCPVVVKPGTFSSEANSSKKPTITPHGVNWCIILPGEDRLIPVSRKGSFNGELFAILGEKRWGEFQTVEHVLEELEKRVTDKRTSGHHYSSEMIREHLKEINERLHEGGSRRLRRIGSWPKVGQKVVGVVWANILWVATLRISRGVLTVGFARVVKPTRIAKKASK